MKVYVLSLVVFVFSCKGGGEKANLTTETLSESVQVFGLVKSKS